MFCDIISSIFLKKKKRTRIFFTRAVDNGIMGEKVQKAVRFEKWMVKEIEAVAKEKGLTFSDMVNKLLRQMLEKLGYTEGKYDAKTYGIGWEAGGGSETKRNGE
jgi:hypothetical protein